jgi:hypothetical protein
MHYVILVILSHFQLRSIKKSMKIYNGLYTIFFFLVEFNHVFEILTACGIIVLFMEIMIFMF